MNIQPAPRPQTPIMQEPDLGRFAELDMSVMYDKFDVGLCEQGMRRAVRVMMPNPDGMVPPDDDPEWSIPQKKAADILAQYIDQLPPRAVAIEVDQAGALLSVSTDPALDIMRGSDHFLLQDYQLPPQVAARTVLRSELTEVGRLQVGRHVDLVSYPIHLQSRSDRGKEQSNCHVFKYSLESAFLLWKEVQVLARLPQSPHLALLDRLVLDEITGSSTAFSTRTLLPGTSPSIPPLTRSSSLTLILWLELVQPDGTGGTAKSSFLDATTSRGLCFSCTS
jgi:hypothetical protein